MTLKNRPNFPPTTINFSTRCYFFYPLYIQQTRGKYAGIKSFDYIMLHIHLLILTLFLIFLQHEFFPKLSHSLNSFLLCQRSYCSQSLLLHFTPIYVLNCSNKYILFAFHIFPHELTKIDFEAHISVL